MNKQTITRIVIICIVVFIAFSVAVLLLTDPASGNHETTYPTVSDGGSIYQTAVSNINNAENISYTVSYKKDMLIGNEYLSEQMQQSIRFTSRGTTDMRGLVEESFNISNHTVEISELYTNNTGYFIVDGNRFTGDITAEAYTQRYTPAALLDTALYAQVTGYDTGNGYMYTFKDAEAIEAWVQADSGSVTSAEGTAHLDADSKLVKSTYSVSYAADNIQIRLSVTVEIIALEADPIEVPTDPTKYTKISYLDGPRMLERACGYLMDTDCLKAQYSDTISCKAFGDIRQQTVTLTTSNVPTWSALIETDITVENISKTGSTSVLTQTEKFADGRYTISTNDDVTTADEVDISTMRSHCRDLLVGTILLPQYIAQATITDSGDAYRIEFVAIETFAQLISSEACETLYQDTTVLSKTAQSYTTEKMLCYLTISKNTGLPLSSGFEYLGTYTIDTLPYPLEYTAAQKYTITNNEADTP